MDEESPVNGALSIQAERLIAPRVACVVVPAFPLQILWRRYPEWRDAPLAVVEADHPQARILWVDARAQRMKIRTGMRYAAALQIDRALRAAPVAKSELERLQAEVMKVLRSFSPRVESESTQEGVFWLDPTGLVGIFGSPKAWASRIVPTLAELQLKSAVAVGFARLPTWAIARAYRGVRVMQNPAEEAALAGQIPLLRLGFEPELRDALLDLGVETLDAFLRLPPGDVGLRFGPEAALLQARYADAWRMPMQPELEIVPLEISAEIDPPDDNQVRLLFRLKGALHALMEKVKQARLDIRALRLELTLERGEVPPEYIEAAEPSRDEALWMNLMHLRLSTLRLPDRAEGFRLLAEVSALEGTQMMLFARRQRDPKAASRALARLCAMFGEHAVTCARLRDANFPERSFVWETTKTLSMSPQPVRPLQKGVLQRRVRSKPERLRSDARGRPRTTPALLHLLGPYRLQGRWWEPQEIARDYFYAELEDGQLLWLFQDRRTRDWFLQGTVN